MELVCGNVKGGGVLDYVTGWYFKAGEYIQNTRIQVGFVSTNSISQGEQVGILWNELFNRYHLRIHFAHRTFAWESEARGKAHVHVVIIGFGAFETKGKRIYDYDPRAGKSSISPAKNISPYLVEGSDVVVLSRSAPISRRSSNSFRQHAKRRRPSHSHGRRENDYCSRTNQPQKKFIRPFLGAEEFINGGHRWCLWLKDASPAELRALPEVMERVEGVRKHREASPRADDARVG